MITANQFIIDHNNDINFMDFINEMTIRAYSHSDRWSKIYDYMAEHYPEATGSLITGLTYYCES